jgi:hypothetical protein
MPQVCHRQNPLEYPPRLTNLRIVDFFNLGCGWLSRFSNHEDLVVVYILGKDKATVTNPLAKTVSVAPARTAQKIRIICGCTLTTLCLVFVFGPPVHSRTKPRIPVQPGVGPTPLQREFPMTKQASGTFEVNLTSQKLENKEAERANLGRMSIDKRFHGDLEAISNGEMLSAVTEVKGSAGYVAIERVSGTLHGRDGAFVLQHAGTMTRGVPQLSVTVVPDSASGDLLGLSGSMTIKIEGGKHSYEFDYTIPETVTGRPNVHTDNESHNLD